MNGIIVALIATLAGMIVGFLWYGPLFGKTWMKLVGLDQKKMKKSMQGGMWKFYGTAILANLIIAFAFTAIIASSGLTGMNIGWRAAAMVGLITSLFCWIAFVMTTMATNYKFAGKPIKLYLIDALHHLVVFLVMGLIIGLLL